MNWNSCANEIAKIEIPLLKFKTNCRRQNNPSESSNDKTTELVLLQEDNNLDVRVGGYVVSIVLF